MTSQYLSRQSSSVVVEKAPPVACAATESMALAAAAESIAIPRNDSIAMTPYGPAPPDMRSHHRTSFTREQLRMQELYHKYAEQQKMQREHFQAHTKLRPDKQQRPAVCTATESVPLPGPTESVAIPTPAGSIAIQRDACIAMRQSPPQHQGQRAAQQSPRQPQEQRTAHQVGNSQLTVGDILDQHVEYYISQHSRLSASNQIQRKRPGCYEIYGREVKLDWEHDDPNGGDGFLVVIDGPLRQAFGDYVEKRSGNAKYTSKGLHQTNLHMIPKDARMSFPEDPKKKYSRLEAMKVAKEQMIVREKAAGYVNAGNEVPSDIADTYNKAIDAKLGKSRANYEASKRMWSKKAREEGCIPSKYPEHLPPGVMNSGVMNSNVFSSAVHP
jgi:hypothetical protein